MKSHRFIVWSCVGLMVSVLEVSNLNAQDSLLYIGPSLRKLGLNTENMETAYYKVNQFGFLGVIVNQKHPVWYYPTSNDRNDSGYFSIDAHNAVRADFNMDGKEDLAISWAITPHVLEREINATFSVLLNEGGGQLRHAPELFAGSGPPKRFFAYRTSSADFNMDGRPDLVAASMGMIKRNSDGSNTVLWEPIPLVLSTTDGKLQDASHRIEGQENGGLPEKFSFSHELSAGDVNADGFPDFFTGGLLFINDGTGNFSNEWEQTPSEFRPAGSYLMTSLIGDLNGDGVGDIVAAYADNDPQERSGYIWLSNGNGSFSNRTLVALPTGLFGSGNTKFNHGVIYDVNRDGLPDIVFSVTRSEPYYKGRRLQILINKGNNVFADETTLHLVEQSYLDSSLGEGSLFVADVDGDGIPDLVHSSGSPNYEYEAPGLVLYVNKNGKLELVDQSVLAWVQPWQLEGYGESVRPWQTRAQGRTYPINLDGEKGIDFVSQVTVPLKSWPQVEPSEISFYSVLAKNPVITNVKDENIQPASFRLSGNYPNPFNPSTKIRFSIHRPDRAIIEIVDLLGRPIRTVFDGFIEGEKDYEVLVDATGLSSGMYLVRLQAGDLTTHRKIMLVR